MMEYVGEGHDTPLQYSCLENAMDGGAWWAAVLGVGSRRLHLALHRDSKGDKMGSLGERRAPRRGTRMPFEEHDDEVRAETV